jgi:hypothetical protein
MSLSVNLLALLPHDLPVVNCAECGRLATGDWGGYRRFKDIGLRLLVRWRPQRNGHRRPVCDFCDGFGRPNIPGPGEHRPEGQGVPIWRDMKSL